MIKLKVQSKVSLLLACLLCFWAYNPALAQETHQEPTMAEPSTTQTAEPTPTYSPENPFANSQYTDLADLTELVIQQGYNVDTYFYSEGFTTGTDGVLGNEYICIRDDVNQVYIGRSDICKDRAADSTYSYVQIDKMDWTNGFPDEIVMQTGDLLGNTSQYWDGCYTLNQGWGGTSGGSCPTINDQYGGQINFGYVERTLTNLAAINIALEEAGVEATGYNYSWSVKNGDANRTNTGNGRSTPDPFYVEVVIRDTQGTAVFSKTYDYSQYMEWTNVSGEETFADPFDVNTLESIQLNVTGKDLGYWAGYYGPEFANPDIKLNYRYTGNPAAEDTTVDDTLFSNQCTADPLNDPACPGYNDAMMAQINSSTSTDDLTGGVDIVTTTQGTSIDDGTSTTTDPIASTTIASTGGIDPTTGSDDGSSATGVEDPVNTQTQIAGTADVIEEPVEEATASVSETATSSNTPRRGTGLNANQLAALDAADAASAGAESLAGDAAGASAGVGLSEFGGVGSSLTSVDPTGSTNSLGGMNSMPGQTNNNNGSNNGTDNGIGSSTGTDVNTGFDNEFEVASLDTELSPEEQLQSIQDSAMVTNELPKVNLIADIINQVTQAALNKAVKDAEEVVEESIEESFEEQNAREDELVAAAQAGSDDEDAQAALLGYNPNFRAYQQPQMPGGDIYNDQGVYLDQKTYDNPRAGLFNGASDALHREMVRSQYEN